MTAEVVSIYSAPNAFSQAMSRVLLDALTEHMAHRPLLAWELEALCDVLGEQPSEMMRRAAP